MTRERLEVLADTLLIGVFVFVASLPLVTAFSAFGAACAVQRAMSRWTIWAGKPCAVSHGFNVSTL